MPTINIKKDLLFKLLGQTFTDEEFATLCFEFGIELDDVTSEKKMIEKQNRVQASDASEEVIYKIEIPANRYDLLCIEGLSRALRVYLKKDTITNYQLRPAASPQQMIIKQSVKDIRPYVVCAVLRNVTFTQDTYDSFIDLQEKLHANICRRRTLASVGTHDLDTIEGPFTYEALPPNEINFVALNQDTSMTAVDLFAKYDKEESHLKKFLPIIRDRPNYPVIFDSKRRVLSLPPIINGNHSKITLNTKNVFIEVTATDLTKAHVVLNIMTTMFSEYCVDKFTIEPVTVIDESTGKTEITPDLSNKVQTAKIGYINKAVGVNLTPETIVTMLQRMSLESELNATKDEIIVQVPPTRSDIMHACDIMEDVAIGYGYNNLVKELPSTVTVGKQYPINKLSDQLRIELAQAGYCEALTFSLVSKSDNFKKMNIPDDGKTAVVIANPITTDFEIGRTSLLPGLLKTLKSNRNHMVPIKMFEISDVILKDDNADVGAKNRRELAAVYYDQSPNFGIIHGLLDRIMLLLNIPKKGTNPSAPHHYHIAAASHPSFFEVQCAGIYLDDKQIGVLGIINPTVNLNFKLKYPCAALSLNIEPFV